MGREPRLAMLVHALDDRSVSRVVVELAETFERMGVPCHVLTTEVNGETSRLPQRLAVLGPARPTARAIPRLAAALSALQPTALIAHVSGPNLAAALGRALGLVRVPRLVLVELVEWLSHPSWTHRRIRRILTKWLYPRADVLVRVSPGVCDGLRRVAPRAAERVTVIPPPLIAGKAVCSTPQGLADDWFEPRRRYPVVVTVGNVIPRKDHETLVRAAAHLHDHGRPVNVAIIGRLDDQELLGRLRALVHALGLGDHVRFLGYRPHPWTYVASADVFALTSRSEGFGMALVEAMACGTPVVCTDCPGGPRWICQDGEAGILVPVADPPALARAIRSLLDGASLRDRYRAAGLRRAADFDIGTVARRYLEIAGVCE